MTKRYTGYIPVLLPEGIGTVDWTDTVVVINGGEDDEETVMEDITYTDTVVSLRPYTYFRRYKLPNNPIIIIPMALQSTSAGLGVHPLVVQMEFIGSVGE